jgi:hypothetical protein
MPTIATAYASLVDEINRSADTISHFQVSSMVPVGKQGRPLAEYEYKATDPGVAVWLKRRGKWICIACDRFTRPSANMRAIALIIEGRRREERFGTAAMVEASWAAFEAPSLPERSPAAPSWWQVLGVAQDAPTEVVEAAYRALAAKHHPDRGGSHEAMARLNAAIEAARKERSR